LFHWRAAHALILGDKQCRSHLFAPSVTAHSTAWRHYACPPTLSATAQTRPDEPIGNCLGVLRLRCPCHRWRSTGRPGRGFSASITSVSTGVGTVPHALCKPLQVQVTRSARSTYLMPVALWRYLYRYECS